MAVSAEMIKGEVNRYWEAFRNKDAVTLANFYAHESVGFGSGSGRSEPGRMAAIRRQREYFGGNGLIEASIENIEVTQICDSGAVATYLFRFRASRTNSFGKTLEESIPDGRATQVFGLDDEGRLRIFHEHFSQPSR